MEPCEQQGIPTTEKLSAFMLGLVWGCPEVTVRRSRPLLFTEAASALASICPHLCLPTLTLPLSYLELKHLPPPFFILIFKLPSDAFRIPGFLFCFCF